MNDRKVTEEPRTGIASHKSAKGTYIPGARYFIFSIIDFLLYFVTMHASENADKFQIERKQSRKREDEKGREKKLTTA